ncbi:alanine racemase [Pseudonocardia sp. GCM10023141]|uniref:alanine racemase n=1 Tax=Pseudonocardia sp. GCM10023141 TaxID=3252653 RepID=UPI0036094E83
MGSTTTTDLGPQRLGTLEKSLPAAAGGSTVADFLATGPRLSTFGTPLLVLDSAVLDANIERMAAWCTAHGVEIAPHGKTTMAPALWERQLRAGAWGITVATPSQLRVALAAGIRRIQLANALVDPHALATVSRALDADPELQVISWVDAPHTVAAMDAALATLTPQRALTVLVELGAPGGRTGARGPDAARAVVDAVARSPHLTLGGVAAYEGSLAHDAAPAELAVVRKFLDGFAALHRSLLDAGAYPGEVIVTAGGSAYFDDVAAALAPLAGPGVRVLLRSGAYVIHDDGYYRGVSPFSRDADHRPLRSAMHVWARVVSQPEPGLALLDAGRRDVPVDQGNPMPDLVAAQLGSPTRPVVGEITSVADQHAFLRTAPGAEPALGEVVRLRLSHPCTAIDKWRVIPVVDGDTEPDPVVIELVRTYF